MLLIFDCLLLYRLLKQDPMYTKLMATLELITDLESKLRLLDGILDNNTSKTPKLTSQYHAVDVKSSFGSVQMVNSSNVAAKPESTESQIKKFKSDLATQRQVKTWAEVSLERVRAQLRHSILADADIVSGE